MTNCTWNHISLQVSDLPEKARRFISMMDIDISGLEFLLMTPCPDGKYFKNFDESETSNLPKRAATVVFNTIYFFEDYVRVGVAIHELTHVYLRQSKFFNGIEYDLKGMSEKFISQYGVNALTSYARFNIFNNDWEEVICEIIATYGRRGQFNEIKNLLNQ